MNIWIIDHYSSDPKFGGISRQYDFAKEMSNRNYDVTVISSSFSHFSHSYISGEKIHLETINNRARYIYLHTSKYKKNGGLGRIINAFSFVKSVIFNKKAIENMVGKPDVVVGCSVHPFTWIAANNVAKKYKAIFNVEVRDLWPENQIVDEGMSKYHPMAIALGILEKWAYKKANYIIYSLSNADEYICDCLGFSREKVTWIDNPIDAKRFDCNSNRFDELPPHVSSFMEGHFICAFTGYLKDYEGVQEMIQAAKIIKDEGLPIRFIFLGSGDQEEYLKSYAKENNLDNVLIGGRISKELIPTVLTHSDICMAHLAVKGNKESYKYGMSKNKVNEYLCSGRYVIFGSYNKKQVVSYSGGGVTINAFDADAFADEIKRAYYMCPEERAAVGAKGRKYMLENNSVEHLIDKYEKTLSRREQ